MSKRSTSSFKLGRFLKRPIRLLGRARNLYIDTITRCSGRVDVDLIAIGGISEALPRSKSQGFTGAVTSDHDILELIRAGSPQILQPPGRVKSGDGLLPRSPNLMVIRTIDEDRSCNFEEEDGLDPVGMYTRSRSCVVGGGRRRVGVMV